MEKENKKKSTPDINEELMMSLMVDGVKKEGLQLPVEPIVEASEKEEVQPKKLPVEKLTIREKSRTKRKFQFLKFR